MGGAILDKSKRLHTGRVFFEILLIVLIATDRIRAFPNGWFHTILEAQINRFHHQPIDAVACEHIAGATDLLRIIIKLQQRFSMRHMIVDDHIGDFTDVLLITVPGHEVAGGWPRQTPLTKWR